MSVLFVFKYLSGCGCGWWHDVHCNCRAVQNAQLWAMGWPGWVSLEGEGASAQSLGLAGVSGSELGPPEHSGPDTPKGFPW